MNDHVSARIELTIDMKALSAEAALAAVRAHLPRIGLDQVVFLAEQVSDHAFTQALKSAADAPPMAITCGIDGWKITASALRSPEGPAMGARISCTRDGAEVTGV